jgi:hypothetical protein
MFSQFCLKSLKFGLQTGFGLLLELCVLADHLQRLALLHHLQPQLFLGLGLRLVRSVRTIGTFIDFHLLGSYFVVEQSGNVAKIVVSVSQLPIFQLSVLQQFFQIEDFHFHANDTVVLIGNNCFDSSHIDIRFFRMLSIHMIVQSPCFDLSLHPPIFLLHIPDPRLQ